MRTITCIISTLLATCLLIAADSTKLFENTEVQLVRNEAEKSYSLIATKGVGAVVEVTIGENNEVSSISASTVRSPTASATISYSTESNSNRIQLLLSNEEKPTLMIDLNGDGTWDIRTNTAGRSINVDGTWLMADVLNDSKHEIPSAEVNGRKFSFTDKWKE